MDEIFSFGIQEPTKYRHIKTGNIYLVLGTVLDCTNARDGNKMVFYENDKNQVFVRDLYEFLEKFEKVE
ncbi:MAG: DUF1653 domain-containing protein [Clostridia bacterium]|nr:DUF1653 domain-containing protein [Clostridia bacterium]